MVIEANDTILDFWWGHGSLTGPSSWIHQCPEVFALVPENGGAEGHRTWNTLFLINCITVMHNRYIHNRSKMFFQNVGFVSGLVARLGQVISLPEMFQVVPLKIGLIYWSSIPITYEAHQAHKLW